MDDILSVLGPLQNGAKRNNARTAALSRFLGLPEQDENGGVDSQQDLEGAYGAFQAERQAEEMRKAEAAAYSERVKGEYGLQGARIKGEYGVQASRAAQERAATERETAREFTASQNALNRESVEHGRQESQAGQNARTGMQQQGVNGRQMRSQTESRARLYETKDTKGNFKMNAPRPTDESLFDRYLFGPSQETLNTKEASRLRSSALSNQNDASDEDLTALILQKTPDATPEEIEQWISEMRGSR